MNNYFAEGFLACQANIDIQTVINNYKAVAYMCAYFSNSENESSSEMPQASKEASTLNLNAFEETKTISKAYATKKEFSVQGAVYHLYNVQVMIKKNLPCCDAVKLSKNMPQ